MLCAVVTAAGCTSATPSSSATGASGTGAPSTGQTSPGPVASSPGSTASAVQLSFADNGKTVTLHVGGRLHVALDSAFWTYQPVDASRILKLDATTYASPSPGTCKGPQAVGSGCGSQLADYSALATGRTSVVATRASCGEAMRCSPSNGRFEVQVIIEN